MKTISLLQPWASLVVLGKKKIETRSWDTKYRGPLLIQASKKMDSFQKGLVKQEPFYSALKNEEELPRGCIIGKVELLTTSTTAFFKQCSGGVPLTHKYSKKEWDTELAFGDYADGRFGWLLADAIKFEHHFPVKGSLGLWEFDERICMVCGCSEMDCRHCIERTGQPCHWVTENLCSACV
jgi:hypothetical protein